MLLPISG